MKFKAIAICLILIIMMSPAVIAGDTFYIDNTLSGDCTSGNYAIEGRDCSGSDGNAYASLEAFYNGGSGPPGFGPGDTVYLRGGTYTEDYGVYTMMALPFGVDGTGWGADERILLASYPGEWAVIDGNSQAAHVFGLYGLGVSNQGYDNRRPEYWIIERLEITGASGDDNCSGLAIDGGPFKLRYLYVHDNVTSTDGENPGGIRGYHWMGSLVEFCYFNNNGASTWNSGDIVVFSDYHMPEAPDVYTRTSFDLNDCRHSNEIRYCRFDNTPVGFKHKGRQYLMANPSDMTHQARYDKIHHCYFGSGSTYGAEVDSDFTQVYQNIFNSTKLQASINRSAGTGTDPNIYYRVLYNNTVINAPISVGANYQEDHGTNTDVKTFIFNNIVDKFGKDDYQPSFGLCTQMCYSTYCDLPIESCTPNWTTSIIDRNLVHDPQNADHYAEPYSRGLASTRWYTTAEFNAYRSVSNYTNSTPGLFVGVSGADQYRTNGSFIVSGSTTLAKGGIRIAHPYLPGLTIPAFLGATDPADDAWVDGVLNDLTSTAWLRSMSIDRDGNDDPTWIQGGHGDSMPFPGIILLLLSSN